jgi:hypothetical protein
VSKLSRLALALVSLFWLTGATWLPLFVQSGSTPFAISLTAQNSNSASQTTYTFTAQSTGVVDATRLVCVAIAATTNAVTVSSVTTANPTATLSQVSGAAAAATGGTRSDMWCGAITTGTTADISVTFSGAQSRMSLAVYRVVGTGVSVSTGANNNTATTGTSLTQTATIPAGGGAIGVINIHNATITGIAQTNLSNDTGAIVVGTSTAYAGKNTSSSGSTTLGFNWTSPGTDAALSLVTFNP